MTSKAYRVYIPEDDDIVISRDIKVLDKMYYEENTQNYENLINEEEHQQRSSLPENVNKTKNKYNKNNEPVEIEFIENKNDSNLQNPISIERYESSEDSFNDASENEETPVHGKPQRDRHPPAWTKDFVVNNTEESLLSEISLLSDGDEYDDYWHDAIKDEIRAHVKNGTWKIEKKDKEN
ncbi:unnamed protein product [Arctia plantaginis]|uniref:Uncharacterized protein n=1 Tax=Arctia plantaginis TaxID=874455 RepID=A0A8S1B6C7_ARCPL|nr:unnamed protein product [Arctia plantaginis]